MTSSMPNYDSKTNESLTSFNIDKDLDTEAQKASFLFKKKGKGIEFKRFYTKDGVHPYDEIDWEYREASIINEKGEVVFSQKDVEVPKSWSQTATNIAVPHYFRGRVGTKDRETSARQMVNRVAKTMSDWGRAQGYFKSDEDADIFETELTYLLINQHAAFNSPVWYNVGIEERPQCSACFINSVQDDMRSILNLAVTEGMLFKFGSGTGTNLSILRSSKEYLSNSNGKASGPVSFMKGFDAFAGVIKSGGKTRRAAKMVILNIDHPDTVEFMKAVESDGEFHTRYVRTGETADTYRAKDLMRQIAEAAWVCGDPGLQYDTTINKWHTSANTDRINASNPCSEFMFLDNTT